MLSFCGIRSKMYSYEINSGKTVQKAKGVTISVVERYITHQDYLDCLFIVCIYVCFHVLPMNQWLTE